MEARGLLPSQDGDAYAALRRQQAEEDPTASPELKWELVAFASGPDAVIERYPANGTFVWGAFDRRALVGAVAVTQRLSVRVSSYLWMWGLYVRPPYRGTPASRVLMTAALAWCEQQPPEQRLFGAYSVLNVRASQFCSRYGFRRPDEGEGGVDLIRPPGCTLVERVRETDFRSSPIA